VKAADVAKARCYCLTGGFICLLLHLLFQGNSCVL